MIKRFVFLKTVNVLIILAFILFEMLFFGRMYFFVLTKVPSYSMLPCLTSGDYIFVNMMTPGYRTLEIDPDNSSEFVVRRNKGIGQIDYNDVILFNYPYTENPNKINFSTKVHYIKRCIGLPGDTLFIVNGVYHVNGYEGDLGNRKQQNEFAEKYVHNYSNIPKCYPFDSICNWNLLNFGPIYIPKKGDIIVLNSNNFALFKRYIEYETLKVLTLQDSIIYFDEKKIDSYVFKKDYYFMAGDAVYDSNDSRFWGLLPDDFIVGKALFIWKSVDPETNKFRFNRFFMEVE